MSITWGLHPELVMSGLIAVQSQPQPDSRPLGAVNTTLFILAIVLFSLIGFALFAYDLYRNRDDEGGTHFDKDGSLSTSSALRIVEQSATRLVLTETRPIEMSAGLTAIGVACLVLGLLGLPLLSFIGVAFLLPGLFFTAFSRRVITLDQASQTLRIEHANATALGRYLRTWINYVYQPHNVGTSAFAELTDVVIETQPGTAQRSPTYHIALVHDSGQQQRLTTLKSNDRARCQQIVELMRPFLRKAA